LTSENISQINTISELEDVIAEKEDDVVDRAVEETLLREELEALKMFLSMTSAYQ
jgi:hypothetical protein